MNMINSVNRLLRVIACMMLFILISNEGRCRTTDTLALKYRNEITSPTIISYGEDKEYCEFARAAMQWDVLPTSHTRLFIQGGIAPYVKYLDIPTSSVMRLIAPSAVKCSLNDVISALIDNWSPYQSGVCDGGCFGLVVWRCNRLYMFAFWDVNGTIKGYKTKKMAQEANQLVAGLKKYFYSHEKEVKRGKK